MGKHGVKTKAGKPVRQYHCTCGNKRFSRFHNNSDPMTGSAYVICKECGRYLVQCEQRQWIDRSTGFFIRNVLDTASWITKKMADGFVVKPEVSIITQPPDWEAEDA